MPHMDTAIGIRRAVVKNKLFFPNSFRAYGGVEIFFIPQFKLRGFLLKQICQLLDLDPEDTLVAIVEKAER